MRSSKWTRENLAWLAGLVEGEGCFYLRVKKDRPRSYITFSLQMTDVDIVDRAQSIMGGMGGRFVDRRSERLNKNGTAEKDCYHWRVQQEEDVLAIMYAIYPWLGERRQEKVRECIAAWRSLPRRRRMVHPLVA